MEQIRDRLSIYFSLMLDSNMNVTVTRSSSIVRFIAKSICHIFSITCFESMSNLHSRSVATNALAVGVHGNFSHG